ncbi:unnamed protein product [Caenorhabditis bovis]|uniref:Uncharacterized protein n=1 Tax=Caenorhabditis bovis TaxID=2654633 RepID=A0A8S1EDA6_9PELO|nr:unnamed protein product [Caenorhabditis bovis]
MKVNFTTLPWPEKCDEYDIWPAHIVGASLALFGIIGNGFLMKHFQANGALYIFTIAVLDLLYSINFLTEIRFKIVDQMELLNFIIVNFVPLFLIFVAIERVLWTCGQRTRETFGIFTNVRPKPWIRAFVIVYAFITAFFETRPRTMGMANHCEEIYINDTKNRSQALSLYLEVINPWLRRVSFCLALVISLISVIRRKKTGKGETAVSQSDKHPTSHEPIENGIRLVNQSNLCMLIIVVQFLLKHAADEAVSYQFAARKSSQFEQLIVKFVEVTFAASRILIYLALTKLRVVYEYVDVVRHT